MQQGGVADGTAVSAFRSCHHIVLYCLGPRQMCWAPLSCHSVHSSCGVEGTIRNERR